MHRRTLLLATALTTSLGSVAVAQNSLNDFNFDRELDRARNMGRELQPRLARIGLLFFEDAMLTARTLTTPRGYEIDAPFQEGSRLLRRTLLELLSGDKSSISEAPLDVPADAVRNMSERFSKNRPELPAFLADIKKPPGPLQALPDLEIVRYQLWIATLVAARSRNTFEVVWKITGFCPFC